MNPLSAPSSWSWMRRSPSDRSSSRRSSERSLVSASRSFRVRKSSSSSDRSPSRRLAEIDLDAERVFEGLDGDESEHRFDLAEGEFPVQIDARVDQVPDGQVAEELQLVESALTENQSAVMVRDGLADVVEHRGARDGLASRRIDDRVGDVVEAESVERAGVLEFLEQHAGQHRTCRSDVAQGHVIERTRGRRGSCPTARRRREVSVRRRLR